MRSLFFALLFTLVLSPLYSQEETFGSIYSGLDELETLMNDTLERNSLLERQSQTLTQSLTQAEESLSEAEEQSKRQSELAVQLRRDFSQMSEAYKTQSLLLEKSERASRNWRLSFFIGIPTAAGITALIMILAR